MAAWNGHDPAEVLAALVEGGSYGERAGYTVGAWDSAESAAETMRQDQHRAAMRAFFSDGLGVSGWTSVWVPTRFNTLWVRCPACGTVLDADAGDGCSWAPPPPERPPYL
jgi:hypothetical protein